MQFLYKSSRRHFTRRSAFAATVVALYALAAPLAAFQPVRWTPMDAYVLKPLPGGPSSVKVLDPRGRVLSTARYIYDGEGRLLEERFADAGGQERGRESLCI